MKDTLTARYQCRCMMTWLDVLPSRFDSVKVYFEIMEEVVEDSHGVTSAPNTGDYRAGEFVFSCEDLLSGFPPDDALKVADHGRVRVGYHGGAEEVVGVLYVGYHVPGGVVDCVILGYYAGISEV